MMISVFILVFLLVLFCGLPVIGIRTLWKGEPVKVEILKDLGDRFLCRVYYKRGKPTVEKVKIFSKRHDRLLKCEKWIVNENCDFIRDFKILTGLL